jgi:hypothetical protein
MAVRKVSMGIGVAMEGGGRQGGDGKVDQRGIEYVGEGKAENGGRQGTKKDKVREREREVGRGRNSGRAEAKGGGDGQGRRKTGSEGVLIPNPSARKE